MTTHFITAEIELKPQPKALLTAIEQELSQHGQPLRWAIMQVDRQKQTVQVEAVVTR